MFDSLKMYVFKSPTKTCALSMKLKQRFRWQMMHPTYEVGWV